VLDWYHVTMRLTVLGRMIEGAWANAVTVEAKAAALERIKWLLWHGNAATAKRDSSVVARKSSPAHPCDATARFTGLCNGR
jgi:hypothetical protein